MQESNSPDPKRSAVASSAPPAVPPAGGLRAAAAATAAAPTAGGTVTVRVWDLPLRLFHWLLALCLIGSFVTVKLGGSWMDWHFRFGYTALTLILFRLMWGLVGPRYARFSSFLFSPAGVIAYLRNAANAPRTLGHSPVGALSVFALLAIVGIQACAGLFTSDDIANEGPLARLVSNATVSTASWIHHTNENIILALVGLHIAAILYYRIVRHLALVKPMVVGDKVITSGPLDPDPATLSSKDDSATRVKALVVAGIAVATVAVIVNWPVI